MATAAPTVPALPGAPVRPADPGPPRPDRLRATAREFETVFLQQMLSQMFSTLPEDSLTGGGQAQETWRGLLVEQYARKIAEGGGIGIAQSVHRELLRFQEIRP